MLDRDGILACQDLETEAVEVAEWCDTVYVRTMTGKERDHFEQTVADQREGERFDVRGVRALLVALTLCDENGEGLFTADDVDALNAKSAAALDTLFDVSRRLNHLRPEDVEDLAGN